MESLVKQFFDGFLRKNKKKILLGSFWRIVACIQTLFWPFAFAKIVNIITQNPADWKRAIPWLAALVLNKALEDLIRLRSKYFLQKIVIKLKTELTCFFTQETELKEGIKTGEAVQDVKKMTEGTESLAAYYKNTFLQLPINIVVIPFILFRADVLYFVLLVAYTIIYLIVDYFWATLYAESRESSIEVSEELWGTTYRKAPDVWRAREDGQVYKSLINKKAKEFFEQEVGAQNIHYWRWTSVQILSTLSRGVAIIFVMYRIIRGRVPVGDLILVNSYFSQTQASLNILTSTVRKLIDWKVIWGELEKAVKPKGLQEPKKEVL